MLSTLGGMLMNIVMFDDEGIEYFRNFKFAVTTYNITN